MYKNKVPQLQKWAWHTTHSELLYTLDSGLSPILQYKANKLELKQDLKRKYGSQ